MAYDFPNAPLPGQVFQNWMWDSEKWVQTGNPAASGAVRFDLPQGLNASQMAQGRQNIYAAPFDAMATSGMQINGSMEVSQEFGTTGQPNPTGSFLYTLDGWLTFVSGNGTFGFAQAASGPPGFSKAIYLNCGTAFNMAGGNDLILLTQRIEGYRWARLGWGSSAALPITVCFWVYASVAGTMSVCMKNAASTRSYAVPVTVNSPSTWEYKVVSIPGDVAGTWATDNTIGASLCFTFGAGSTRQGPANTWAATDIYAHTGVSNFYAANSNITQVTGVVVLPGTDAPSAARSSLIMRPYDQELALCTRYWQKIASYRFDGYNSTAAISLDTIPYPPMRSAPTVAFSAVTNGNCSVPSANTSTVNMTQIYVSINATAPFSLTSTIVLNARL